MEEAVIKSHKAGAGKGIAILLSVILLLAVAAWFLIFRVNHFYIDIAISGDPEIFMDLDEEYAEQGATAVLKGTFFWKNGVNVEVPVEITGDVNCAKPGKYGVDYHAQYRNLDAADHRMVRVVDSVCPVIELTPDPEEVPFDKGEYIEAGYKATDNFDGDITDRVVRIVNEGLVTYAVTDSSGNPAYAEREIPVIDIFPPEIKLNGGESITAFVGEYMEEPGFSALDYFGDDITQQVQVEGEVVWYRPGTYEVVYTVSDNYENTTTVTREVTIEAKPYQQTVRPNGKVIYLTFDDGPGPYTDYLLGVLKAYNVKATFFVVDTGNDALMRKIVKAGHSIGIHSMTHDYEKIYASPEAFFADLFGMQEKIYEATGVRTYLMRFPGGSSNTVSAQYSKGIMSILSNAVQDAGFRFFDWNVDSNDAGGALKTSTVVNNVKAGAEANRISVVLQHDIHPYSVYAVEDIIVWGLENGYKFLPLTDNSETAHHGVNN